MPKFTAQQLQDIAQHYNDMGDNVEQVRLKAIHAGAPLSDPQVRDALGRSYQLYDLGATFAAKAAQVTLADVTAAIATITDATTQANTALSNLQKLDKAITIASDAVVLATAIFTGDPKQIASAAKDVITASLPAKPAAEQNTD